MSTSYAVVTPVRNEEANLPRLAQALLAQNHPVTEWLLVDTGSTDGTESVARELEQRYPRIRFVRLEEDGQMARGAPIVRAFEQGLAELSSAPDVVVKLDADVAFGPDYFERLMVAFEEDERLGMASGICMERQRGDWRPRHVTGSTVWGASRAYRRACLDQIMPLERRMGWDGVDEFRANASGWRTGTIRDLFFFHHRKEGERDGSAARARAAQGEAAWYLGYRPWYLLLRALHYAPKEPAALAMISGYTRAALSRQPQCADEVVRGYLRGQQAPGKLPARIAEALGRR
jgi:glycosyltransferase involved in cell wall biosynthesis